MSRPNSCCCRPKLTSENVSLKQRLANVVIRFIQVFLPISTELGVLPMDVGEDGARLTCAGGWGYNGLAQVRERRQVASTSVSIFFRSIFCFSHLTVRQSSSSTLIAADVSLSDVAQVSMTGLASVGMFY